MKKLIELGVAIDTAIDAADEYDGGYNFERERKIRDSLMALPTVDAVPVRHGHWVKWYEEVCDSFGVAYVPHCKCSECGREYDPYDANHMNYCFNCGARLDGKDGDRNG
jgi:hypothetical protein